MNQSLPTTAPHFAGLDAALILFALLLVVLAQRRVTARLGRRRGWVLAGGTLLLLALGLFGSGVEGVALRGVFDPASERLQDAAPRPKSLAAARSALDVAVSDRFVAYEERLHNRPVDPSLGARIRAHLTTETVDYQRLRELGSGVSPLPPPGARFVVYQYYDVENFGLALFGVGERQRNRAERYLGEWLRRAWRDLVLLELYQSASDNAGRIAALGALEGGVPKAAEWDLAALARFDKEGPRPAVERKLENVRKYLQRYVKDPTAVTRPGSTPIRRPVPGP